MSFFSVVVAAASVSCRSGQSPASQMNEPSRCPAKPTSIESVSGWTRALKLPGETDASASRLVTYLDSLAGCQRAADCDVSR